jgi:hypothetical protein
MKNRHRVSQVVSKLICSQAARRKILKAGCGGLRRSIKRDDFFPRQLIGGAPAHDRQHIALLDEPAHPATEFGHA